MSGAPGTHLHGHRWLGHNPSRPPSISSGTRSPRSQNVPATHLRRLSSDRACALIRPALATGWPHRRSAERSVGEPACRPDSVPPLARGGGHPSGTAVADSLVRSTREHRAGRPQSLAQGAVAPLLTLLRVGFTEPPQSPAALVVSYTTVSPLPPLAQRRSVFCGTVPRVTPGRRYRPPCPVEPGPSSPDR